MEEAAKTKKYKELSIVLLAFRGVSDEDLQYARKFGKEIISAFPNIDIKYVEQDLTPLLRNIDTVNNDLIARAGKKVVQRGSLVTRLISSMVLEFADKTGYCAIDSTNGTEIVLGEFVLGSGGELAPLSTLYKSQVYDLAEILDIPKFVIDRKPINSTFGNDKVFTYFGEIPEGFIARDIYNVLDPPLYLIYRKNYTPEKLAKELGHSLEFSKRIYEVVKKQDHRRSIPYFKILDHRFYIRRTVTEISNEELREWIDNSFCFNDIEKLRRR